MRHHKTERILLSFLIALAVWAAFSWPLPRFAASAIPMSTFPDPGPIRAMVPGDHLQLLYHFGLFDDTLRGQTPPFVNAYEFNLGEGQEKHVFRPYYLPFSLFYTLGARAAGPAFGWNFAGFLSLWFCYLCTWWLVRRYTELEWAAALAALVAITFPYRWGNLLGGSPLGFAMAWGPALLLGLDLAVRNGRVAGGLLAGAALVLAAWGDTHMFFFAALFAPAWCLLALLWKPDFHWSRLRDYLRIAVALLPLIPFTLAAFFCGTEKIRNSVAAGSTKAMARSLNEITLCSPAWTGLFSPERDPQTMHIYLGFGLLAVLLFGLLAMIPCVTDRHRRHHAWRPALVYTLLCAVMTLIVLLALGTHGPGKGRLLFAFRDLIPPYEAIRQPAKILCLLPPCLAVASVLALGFLIRLVDRTWIRAAWAAGLVIVTLEYVLRFEPTLTTLQPSQPAYRAVAEDARHLGVTPRVLVIPLWPGDSHYTSVYECYALWHRIRMINGYAPFPPAGYRTNVFERFLSANQGHLDDTQMDNLLQRGIRHLLAHEDLYPEKVSSFPVGFALQNLADNPRVEFLAQAGPVRAYRLLPAASARTPIPSLSTPLFPVRRVELEQKYDAPGGREIPDPACEGGQYIALQTNLAAVKWDHLWATPSTNLHWLIRARGTGTLHVTWFVGTNRVDGPPPMQIESAEWTWLRVDTPPRTTFNTIGFRLEQAEGQIDLDTALFTGGPWPELQPGQTLRLAAGAFFHAGYSDAQDNVIFRVADDPLNGVFFGPRLPLEKGRYTVDLHYRSDAPPGTPLAVLHLDTGRRRESTVKVDVMAGAEVARGRITRTSNLPFELVLDFLARADLTLREVVITREE